MKFVIELDGTESPDAVARVHSAVNALYDVAESLSFAAAVPTHPDGVGVRLLSDAEAIADLAGMSRPNTLPADAELKAAGFGGGIAANATVAQQETVTAPSVANNFPGVDLDADGLPYDPRIHSSSKTKNKGDNRWKAKRGVDDSVVATVTQELRALLSVPVPNFPGTTTAIAPPPPPPVATEVAAVAPPPPPPVAAVAPPPPPPVAATSGEPSTFIELMGWVGPLTTAKKLTPDTISAVLSSLGVMDANGVGQLALLMQRPDLIPAAYAGLKAAAGV